MDTTTIITRSKNNPESWSAMITVNGVTIEADIRPDSRRRLERENDIAVDPAGSGETYETLILTKKTK